MKRFTATLALTLTLSVAAYLVLVQTRPAEIPFTDPTRIAAGSAIYATQCASCHGSDLKGQPGWETRDADGYYPAPPQDESGHVWHHPDALLLDIVKRGPAAVVGGGYQSRMPGFGDSLSDDEILSVLAYIKSTWPLVIVEAHAWVNGKPTGADVRPGDLAACGLSIGLEKAQAVDS